MTWPFALIALLTIASAVAAMSLRNLVHCVLALTVTFAGLAAFYLQLDAQFVGFAQVLVYVGAVAILIVFALLLTRGAEPPQQSILSSGSDIARRYCRSEVSASKQSTAARILAPMGISSPLRPSGYPVPFHRSCCACM